MLAFMFKQLVGQEIDGGVSCGRFVEDASAMAGGISGY